MDGITLRPVADQDLDHFFTFQQDPRAWWLAAALDGDPADRTAFDARWARLRVDRSVVPRTIELEGAPVGHIMATGTGTIPRIAFWVDPARWNQGIATAALAAFLIAFTRRPVRAQVPAGNGAAVRVLERNEFFPIAVDHAWAPGRGEDIAWQLYERVLFPHLAPARPVP